MKYRDLKGVMEYSRGLFLYDPPTGKGKSYAARNLLYRNSKAGNKKQIFITNNIKNLSSEEMKALYKSDGREGCFKKEVLHVKSNVDFVLENLNEMLAYPDKYKTDIYHKIVNAINEYKNESGERKRQLHTFIREDLEPEFRRELKKLVLHDLPSKLEERQKIVSRSDEWAWLRTLYPTADIWNYSIFFMTVKKFIQVVDPIVDASFIFMNSDFTEDATIVIDEFDETKQVLLNEIVESAMKSKSNLLDSFRRIHSTLTNPRNVKIIQKYDKELNRGFLVGKGDGFPGLIEEVEGIYEDNRLDLSYKTIDTGTNSVKVVFFDGDNHYSYDAENNLTSGIINEQKEQVELSFVSKVEYSESVKSGVQMKPLNTIKILYNFVEKFHYAVTQWAQILRTNTNANRNINDSRMTRNQSIESLYRLFHFPEDEIKRLLNRKVANQLNHNSYYFDETKITMRWYEYVDSDSRYFETMIQILSIDDIPESAIVSLASRARVIGLSATAMVPTILGNYDLRRIQKQLGTDFHIATHQKNLISQETMQEYSQQYSLYEKNRILFDTYSFDKYFDEPFSKRKIKNIISEFKEVDDETLLEKLAVEISTDIENAVSQIKEKETSYFADRYMEVVESFCIFINSSQYQSILALQTALPKRNHPEFDETILLKIFNALVAYYEITVGIFILKGDHFEKKKEEMLTRLSGGEKLYILTSYATTGAGQNLQYKACEPEAIVRMETSLTKDDLQTIMKDIDGVYLGNITYLLSYLNVDVPWEMLNKQVLYLLLEIEYLYTGGEIDLGYKNELIDSILKVYATRQSRKLNTRELSKTISVRLKATKLVIQAVGRITRTTNKSNRILFLISPKLLGNITESGLNTKLITPEMAAVLAHKKEKWLEPVVDAEVQRNRRNNLVMKNAANYLNKLLKSIHHSEQAREEWRLIRRRLLTNPTLDYLPNDELASAYIESPGGMADSYYYAKDDYGNYYLGKTKLEVEKLGGKKEQSIFRVSKENANLPILLKYPRMKELFKEEGYSKTFSEAPFMVNPIFFQAILKGAYGEIAGKFIVETELETTLHEIRTDAAFELFDYRDDSGNYYDFKNWNLTFEVSLEESREKVRSKFCDIGGKHAWIINLIDTSGNFHFDMTNDKKIIEIAGLIDLNGQSILKKQARMIWGELSE